MMIKWQEKAILEIDPNANYSATIVDDNITNIDWSSTPISMEDINAKAEEIKAKEEYIDLRKNEYPSIADQLDDIFHNGIDGWKQTIQAVKDKYPKE